MNRKMLLTVVLAVIVSALLLWLLLPDREEARVIEASGTVEATEAELGFQAPGRIASIQVTEGASVIAGAGLARLEQAEPQARREQAQSQLAAARALLTELQRGAQPQEVAQAEAAALAAREQMEEAAREMERSRILFEGGAVSREQRDRAVTAHEIAQARYVQAREQASLLRAGPRDERVSAQRAAVRGAEAVVAQAEAALATTVIRAPFPGVITLRHREPGEVVAPGQPVLTLMNPNDRWVRIYVPENRIGKLSLGSPARITSDSDPDRSYAGRVTFIADRAEFTPRNVQTAEERVKLVYAVKIEIVDDREGVLKTGVPADVRIRVR